MRPKTATINWEGILNALLERIERSPGAHLHAERQNKFENWLQVEFVGLLMEQVFDSDRITVEKEVDGPYWDVVINTDHRILVDLKVFARRDRSRDLSRLRSSLVAAQHVRAGTVWYLILSIGHANDDWVAEVRNMASWGDVIGPIRSDRHAISLWAGRLGTSSTGPVPSGHYPVT